MGIEHSIQKVTTCSSTPVCKSPSKDPRNSKGGPTDRATIILNDKTQLGPNISAKRRSRKSNNKQATPTKPPKVSKTVFIESEDGTKLKIPIDTSQENFTCEWLTNQAREVLSQNNLLKLESSHPLVTLQTADGNITIDYWLSCPTRSISILKDGMILKPFYGDNRYQIGENKVNLKYFHFVKLLGSGGFSKVYLIRRKDNGKLLALKAICKEELTDQDKRQAIVNERDVFVRLHHPFLTKLHFAFQTVTHLFFVMDFFPGGDLFYHLSTRKKFTEDQVKVYVGEIILALNYLHKNNIIYRDIKPENILVDIDGHLHLSDFGLCKPLNNKLDLNFTFCGSPEYLAPEMIQNVGYSFPVDHYGLGILVYELVVGRPPFHTRKHGDLMDQIVSKKVQFPSGMSANLQSFLSMLLNKNAKKRLGAKGGFAEIIAHPWCQEIDLAKIAKKKVKPPIVPNLHQMNFDKGFLEKEITLEDDNSVMYSQDFQDYFRYDMDDGAILGQLRRSKAQSEPYKNFSFYSNIDDPYDKYLDSMLASKQDDDDELDINAIKLVEKLNKSDGEIKPQNELICQAFKSEKSTNAFAGKFNLNIEQACLENYEEDPYEGPFSAKELASYTTQPIKPLKDTGSNPFASLVQTQTSIVFNEKPKGKHKATLSYDASLKDPRYLAPSTAVSSLQWISTGPNSNQSLPKSTTNLKKEINADKSQDSLMLDEFEIEAVHSCNSVRELPKIRGLKKPHTQVIKEGVNVK